MPAISDDVLSSPRSLRELGREPLDPPVDAHVIHLSMPRSEELLDVSVGKTEPQVPSDRQGDDLGREPVSGEGARRRSRVRVSRYLMSVSLPDDWLGEQCNSALPTAPHRSGGRGGFS
jgi:hypothetical protein